jgi:hypothetical protein
MRLKITDTVQNIGLTETVINILHISDFDTGASVRDLISVYSQRIAEVALNAGSALTTSDKQSIRIPSVCNGWDLYSVAASLGAASSSGTPTFTIKNGATSMLSTNLTVDQGETDSKTAATPAVIDTSHDSVATGDRIEVACSVAGTGVTYAVIEMIFKDPA